VNKVGGRDSGIFRREVYCQKLGTCECKKEGVYFVQSKRCSMSNSLQNWVVSPNCVEG